MSTLPDRLRLRYEKTGRVRFTSQRDTARVWERVLQQVKAPLRYSEGFSPHPLIAFAIALPTGAASTAEYLDVRLNGDEAKHDSRWTVGVDATDDALEEFVKSLNERLPEGLAATAACALDGSENSLQEQVACVRWELVVQGITGRELEDRIERTVNASVVTVARERKGRHVIDDIRSNIHALRSDGRNLIEAELSTQPRGIRPKELLEALDPALTLVRATRTHQWIDNNGLREEPLTAGTFRAAVPSVAR